MRWFASTALVVLLLTSCGSDDSGGDEAGGDETPIVMTDADSGSEISVATGESFEVRLESNPSTGYEWQVDLATLEGLIEVGSTTFEEPDTDLVGAAGTQVFEFEATGSGAGILRFEYLRPFDDPPVPERIVEFIVRVDGAPWPPEGSDAEPPATTTVSAPDSSEESIELSALFDGEGPRDATVSGFVVWDQTSARLCETLMESYPPQCGWLWIVIADPEKLDVGLEEAQGVRWTSNRVDVAVRFDGDRLIVDPASASVEPSPADQALVDAFLAFAEAPGTDTVTALPLAADVALGLGPDIVTTRNAADLVGPGAWTIDREEFRAWAGPFSALDLAAPPITITVGTHARCAAPPEPAPEGFADLRRISIQPTTATSCLEWWTVDFFLDDNGDIAAVTLDLFEP